jgi:hypothetical protein
LIMKKSSRISGTTLVNAVAGALILSATVVPGPASAQSGIYAYPAKGQSQEQQQQDQIQCHQWAVNQTGFDPNFPPPDVAPRASGSVQASSGVFGRGAYGEGGGLLDAGKGAGLGAIGGAIAGNPAAGAAIGALSGLFLGGIRRSNEASERQAWHRQHQQEVAAQRRQQVADWNRAYFTCMTGRGYRVG